MEPDITNYDEPALDRGIVYKKNKSSYEVFTGRRRVLCVLSTRLWKAWSGEKPTHKSPSQAERLEHDPIAVGDRVRIALSPDGTGTIMEIMPRQNWLSRQTAVPMPDAQPMEQVIAANVDLVIPVFAAANPAPRWNLLDRYLVTAGSRELPALICITKLDLVQDGGRLDGALGEVVDDYRRIGYPVILVSSLTGEGINELREALRDRIAVFLGKSGVGKTSLLNALQPNLGLRINQVNRVTGKGRHTTTAMELFPLETGGAVVDTPGVREFGLWDVDEDELAEFFPELRPYLGRCRFGLDCRHDEEPGCAVRKAVMAGQISPRRYQSYMMMKQGD